ncbi:hypothetical protein AAG570_009262 [Ranatra chinensis]|uniref:Uncharacterized protein n=1 Tax=Ranatra chinensis TaxID=642074 RepID=A0ABD0YT74_9HEMI
MELRPHSSLEESSGAPRMENQLLKLKVKTRPSSLPWSRDRHTASRVQDSANSARRARGRRPWPASLAAPAVVPGLFSRLSRDLRPLPRRRSGGSEKDGSKSGEVGTELQEVVGATAGDPYGMMMVMASMDNGPHRELPVDVPDSFMPRNKTPPRYPPPRIHQIIYKDGCERQRGRKRRGTENGWRSRQASATAATNNNNNNNNATTAGHDHDNNYYNSCYSNAQQQQYRTTHKATAGQHQEIPDPEDKDKLFDPEDSML